RRGGICAFIDAEHAMDPAYAKRIGVDIDNLLVSQPDTGEQALEIAELLIRSGALDVVAVDSVAALTPKAEIEGEMGDSHVGLQARLMSQAMGKLAGRPNRTGISWEGTVLDVGIERKIVQKSGSYFSFADERLGQGRQNAVAFLREHPDVVQGILTGIQSELGAEQIVSARLLPSANGASSEVTPVDVEAEAEAEAEVEAEVGVGVD